MNRSSNKLLFLDDARILKANIKEIKKNIRENAYKVICLSDPAYFILKEFGINCESFWDYCDKDLYSNIYQTARDWALNWYKAKGIDHTIIKGYSCGEIYEWSMTYFFTHLLRIYLTLDRIICHYEPDDIVMPALNEKTDSLSKGTSFFEHLDLNLYTKIIEVILKNNKLKGKISLVYFHNLPSAENKRVIKKLLSWIAGYVNLIFSKIIYLVNLINGRTKKILFFEGYRHFKFIISSKILSNFQIILLHKTIGISLLSELYRNLAMVVSLEKNKPIFKFNFKLKIDSLRSDLIGFFIFNQVDLFECAWPRLEFLLNIQYPKKAALDIAALNKIILRTKPDCVVTENDTTYLEKMLVMIAKSNHIPTVVTQNGSLAYDNPKINKSLVYHDFYPFIADYFFAFGEIDKKWFEDLNVSSNKVVVTGGARFDCYYPAQNGAKQKKDKNVLVLLNEIGFEEGVITHHLGLGIFYKHIGKFIELAKSYPDINFIIRPHEDYQFWKNIFNDKLKTIKNISIDRIGKFDEILPNMDLVIGYVSTALVEAAICRKPVISLDTGEFNNFLRLWENGLSVRVADIDQLNKIIPEILKHGEQYNALMKNIDAKIEYYNYKDDGRSSERIANYLVKIINSN